MDMSLAGQGRQGRAGQGRAGQGRAGQGRAGEGKGREAQAEQHSTEQLSPTQYSTTLAVYGNIALCIAMQVVPTGRRMHLTQLHASSCSLRMHQLAWPVLPAEWFDCDRQHITEHTLLMHTSSSDPCHTALSHMCLAHGSMTNYSLVEYEVE